MHGQFFQATFFVHDLMVFVHENTLRNQNEAYLAYNITIFRLKRLTQLHVCLFDAHDRNKGSFFAKKSTLIYKGGLFVQYTWG